MDTPEPIDTRVRATLAEQPKAALESIGGHCMFKVYLGRDENRQMHPAQIARFEALRDRLAE